MTADVDDAIQLIRMEYSELPGLALTFWQVQRLCRLSEDVCTSALAALVRSGYLQPEPGGQYVRPPAESRVVLGSRSPTAQDAGAGRL